MKIECDMTKEKNISQPKFCMHCGKEMDDGGEFCAFCGKRIKAPENKTITLEDKYFNAIVIGLLVMIICICCSACLIAFLKNTHQAVSMDTNELIAQNQNTIEGKEGIVAGEVVGKEVLENIREIDEEGQNDVEEKDNIVISREIAETKPYLMEGACHPMCFIIQPYLNDEITQFSTTPALIFLSCYSIENQQANVVYMNGYTLQYDFFAQEYYRLNDIMAQSDMLNLLSVINSNYFLNLSECVLVNFSLFGEYADMTGGLKLDIDWNEEEFKQIQDIYKEWGREDEIIAFLEKLKNNEKLYYDDFEDLSVICNLSTSITEGMRGKIGRELFALLLQIIESNEFDMLYDNFLSYSYENSFWENAVAIKEDYVWNQSRSIGQWYHDESVGQCFIQENYINYVKNVKYLLHGEVSYAAMKEVQKVNEKLEEAKERFNKLD